MIRCEPLVQLAHFDHMAQRSGISHSESLCVIYTQWIGTHRAIHEHRKTKGLHITNAILFQALKPTSTF